MPELKKVYSYLGSLERRIKFALTMFSLVLFSGAFVAGVGVDKLSHYSQAARPELLVVIGLGALATILTLVSSVSRTSWMDELHIRIDENIFGFLKRTNKTIFGSLVYALKPEDRKMVTSLPPERQSALVQSVFSTLSHVPSLFENFLRTKIFRNWTFYWIMVYGTLTYSLLTVVSFVFVALGLDPYAKLVFTIFWILAAVHLTALQTLGHRLVTISKRLVDSMVESHKQKIAQTLRDGLTEEDETEEAELILED